MQIAASGLREVNAGEGAGEGERKAVYKVLLSRPKVTHADCGSVKEQGDWRRQAELSSDFRSAS